MLVSQTKNSRKIHAAEAMGGTLVTAVSQLLNAAALSTGVDPKALMAQVTRMLGIPDVHTARGLKECHQKFGVISSTLDELFTQMRANPGCSDLLAIQVIIYIYGRMAEDISLRTRIFNETNFLENATALLFSSNLRAGQAVIGALDLITRVSLTETTVRLDKLASFTANVLRYAETHCPDGECMQDAMGVVTRCTAALLAGPDPDAAILALLPRVIRLSLDVILLPTSTLLALRNMVISYSWMSGPLATHSLSSPDVTEFLVAGTRARDIRTRCLAQSTLLDMYRGKTRTLEKAPSELQRNLHPGSKSFVVEAASHREVLTYLARAYASGDFSRSQSGLAYAFSALIQENEPAVRETMQRNPAISNIFQICEAAVRLDDSSPEANIAADILRLELLLSQNSEKEKVALFAASCMAKHPSVAYFYYVMTIGIGQTAVSFPFAEQGLQCCITTEFIRQELLRLTSSVLFYAGRHMLHGKGYEPRLQTISVLMNKAKARTSAFLQIAPMDHPATLEMIAIGTLLDLLIKGHNVTDDELQIAASKSSSAYDIARSTDDSVELPSEYLALTDILVHMSSAWRRWAPTMSRLAGDSTLPPLDADFDDHYDAWLETLNAMTPHERLEEIMDTADFSTIGEYGPSQLHRCSACSTPGAALRRCAGCRKARYCNVKC